MDALKRAASIARAPDDALAPRDIPRPGTCRTSTATAPWPRSRCVTSRPTRRPRKLLVEAHKDGRWTPGGAWNPRPDSIHYEVLRDLLLLLAKANVTPGQRAALIGVLGNYEGATALPETTDRRGRSGRGVEIAGVKIGSSPPTRASCSSGPSPARPTRTCGRVASASAPSSGRGTRRPARRGTWPSPAASTR